MSSKIFSACVDLLEWAARKLGTTYVKINVWTFCVIWPAITFALVVTVILQWMKIAELQAQ